MREIKFRAWDKDWKMIIIPKQHYAPEYKDGHIAEMYNPEENEYHVVYDRDERFVLMQYTGLKDKNGKEIFEGDIVKVPVEINKENFGEWSYREIKFNNGGFLSSYLCSEKGQVIPRGYTASFLSEEPDLNMKVMLWGEEPYQIDQFEIVGNIYENPELLNPLSND